MCPSERLTGGKFCTVRYLLAHPGTLYLGTYSSARGFSHVAQRTGDGDQDPAQQTWGNVPALGTFGELDSTYCR